MTLLSHYLSIIERVVADSLILGFYSSDFIRGSKKEVYIYIYIYIYISTGSFRAISNDKATSTSAEKSPRAGPCPKPNGTTPWIVPTFFLYPEQFQTYLKQTNLKDPFYLPCTDPLIYPHDLRLLRCRQVTDITGRRSEQHGSQCGLRSQKKSVFI